MKCPECKLEVNAIVRFTDKNSQIVVCIKCNNLLVIEDNTIRKLSYSEKVFMCSNPAIKAIIEVLSQRQGESYANS